MISDLFHQLFSALGLPDESRRSQAVAAIGDVADELNDLAPAMAGLLIALLHSGVEDELYEQALFTLGELSVVAAIPMAVLEPLRGIVPSRPWEAEYLSDILTNAEDRSGRNS